MQPLPAPHVLLRVPAIRRIIAGAGTALAQETMTFSVAR